MYGSVWALISIFEYLQISEVTFGLFVTSSILASLFIARYDAKWHRFESAPGPWAWPVVGNLPAILRGGQPHRALARLATRFGPVMAVSLGPGPRVVVLSSMGVVREALVKNAEWTSDRRIPPLLGYAFQTNGSVIWENGALSKAHRRIVLTAFRKCLGKSSTFDATIAGASLHLRDALKLKEARPSNPRDEISAAVSEVMCSICFGHCLDIRSNPKIAEVIQAMHSFSRGLSGISLAHIFPRLYFTPLYSTLRGNIERLKDFLKDIIMDHKRKTSYNFSPETENQREKPRISDVTDMYLMEALQGEIIRKPGINEDEIWRAMFDILGAGTETTSETLLWGVLHMCLEPQVQNRIQAEIDSKFSHIDQDDVITYEERASLPYTHAAVFELLRCACVAPLSLPRITSSDVTVSGYTIPSGTELWVNEWAINRDETAWKDPHEFKPERFLDESGGIDLKKKESFVAFGEGRRVCLGRSLAEIQLFTFFSNLLRWFTFRFPEDCRSLPDINDGNFGLTYSPPPFDVTITSRALSNQSKAAVESLLS